MDWPDQPLPPGTADGRDHSLHQSALDGSRLPGFPWMRVFRMPIQGCRFRAVGKRVRGGGIPIAGTDEAGYSWGAIPRFEPKGVSA